MHFDHYSIRLLTENDLEPYFHLVEKNRKRLEDFFRGTVAKTKTLEDTRNFLKEISEKVKERNYFPYIIVDDTNNRIIGFLDLKNIDWTVPKTEMGCWMDEAFSGKGISAKAFSVFCDFCFDEFQFEKLFLRTHETNMAARKLAEKCGFEIEGKIRKDYKTTSGELVDLVYYGRIS
jgi:ribosomal-protein-serine acetyltransferase